MGAAAVHVVVNLCAERLRPVGRKGNALREAIGRAARAHGAELHETASLGALDAVAARIAEAEARAVVLAGGDGSYMAGVTACARAFGASRLPVFGFAPGGTVSTVARNWGLRGDLARYAARVIEVAARGGRSIPRDTLAVRDDAGGDRIGFIFGAGLVANFFDVYYASAVKGYPGAARIVAKVFAGSFAGGATAARVLLPTPCVLSVDGVEQAPRAYTLVAASVVKDLGLHMHVTYRAGETRGRFHAVASALPPRRLGPQMPRVLLGKGLRGEHHVDALARELRLCFTGERAVYNLDGEPIAAREVRVLPGPVIDVLTTEAQ